MARFEALRDRLPTLYRPEAGDTGLLTLFLQAAADLLETINGEASEVLQAHWFAYADRALYNAYFLRGRQLQGQATPDPDDPTDRQLLNAFPYIHDLAYLAALLPVPPWQEPPILRESVEEYRLRVSRMIALYRNGLGTLEALRRMIEAQLPVDLEAPPERQDQPFWLEEFAPLSQDARSVPTRGEPAGIVGPLMRWTVSNNGLEPASPTIYIQGVEPEAGTIDATANPLIELYQADGAWPRLGIAYRDTIAANQTLRLRPAYLSWLGLADGIRRAEALPGADRPADPTAPGPWQAAAGSAPTGAVVALHQAHDHRLWVATSTEGSSQLWQYDGLDWSLVLDTLSRVRCLAEEGQALLIGTESGLLRMPLYPLPQEAGSTPSSEELGPFVAEPIPTLNGQAVFTIFRSGAGQLWVGTSSGAAQLRVDDSLVAIPELDDTEVYAITQDETATIYFGTSLGLFQYQPGPDQWYWYAGEARTEQAGDWQQFSAEARPTADQVFLPPVRCVQRGPDTSLWLGTDYGLARYVARSVRTLTYETVLEAFPDLTTDRVYAITPDARGLVWFCTDRGLFRYDGRDMWQVQSNVWVQLGRADRLYGADAEPTPRGTWRFQRDSTQWQQYDLQISDWVSVAIELHSAEEAAVYTVLWTDYVAADLGQGDEKTFTSTEAVEPTKFVMRYKPEQARIVTAGLPAVPRLPDGDSVWRYLSLESEEMAEPVDRPAWTIEGRLLPPPPDLAAAAPGRYNFKTPPQMVFAYNPAARVCLKWEMKQPLAVLARLKKRTTDEHLDPAVLDRVWQGIQHVRPAGVHIMLAVEEDIVRGKNNG